MSRMGPQDGKWSVVDGGPVDACFYIMPRGDSTLLAEVFDHDDCARANALLIASAPELLVACKAALLFYTPPPWTHLEQEEWARLVGTDSVTSKTLCDLIRAAVAKAEWRDG